MKNIIKNKHGGQIGIVTSFILLGLFAICLVTFAVNFAVDNNSVVNIANDDDFTTLNSEVGGNITTFYNDINTSRQAMQESTISSQTEATEGGTSFKVGPWSAMSMAISTVTIGFQKIFGSGPLFIIIFTSISALLTMTVVLFILKAWKGSPD
jgi:hypothetical protein